MRGRSRSNVWTYPGASSLGSDARRGLQDHPTVKPTAMLEDALLDLTNRGDIVLDPFLGSGSTLIAADKAGRACEATAWLRFEIDVAANDAGGPKITRDGVSLLTWVIPAQQDVMIMRLV